MHGNNKIIVNLCSYTAKPGGDSVATLLVYDTADVAGSGRRRLKLPTLICYTI